MAEAGYRPPLPRAQIPVAGDVGIATFKCCWSTCATAASSRAHDFEIATPHRRQRSAAATIERGQLVDEEWLLDARTQAFRGAGADAEDAGTHRAHDEDRQAAAELTARRESMDASTRACSRRDIENNDKQIQDAYIVAATRTPVGKAPRGMFRNTRPDDLLAHVLQRRVAQVPGHRPDAHRRRHHRLRDARGASKA